MGRCLIGRSRTVGCVSLVLREIEESAEGRRWRKATTFAVKRESITMGGKDGKRGEDEGI